MTGTHKLPIRVYYEDTDAGGIVYHASYLRFAERGRTEYLRALGFDHPKLLAEQKLGFAVVHLEIDYKLPAKLDDLLTVHSSVTRTGGASFDMKQIILRGAQTICEINLTLVCIDQNLKAVKLPESLRELFKSAT